MKCIPLAPLRYVMSIKHVSFRFALQQLLTHGLIKKVEGSEMNGTSDDPLIWSDDASYQWKGAIKFPKLPVLLRLWNDILILIQLRLLISFLRLFPEPFRYEALNEFFYFSLLSYLVFKVYPTLLSDLFTAMGPLISSIKQGLSHGFADV